MIKTPSPAFPVLEASISLEASDCFGSPYSPPSSALTLGSNPPSPSAFNEPEKKIQLNYSYFTPKVEFEFKAKASKQAVEGKSYVVIKHEVVNLKKIEKLASEGNNSTPVQSHNQDEDAQSALALPQDPSRLRVASIPAEERSISKLIKRIKELDELFSILDYCSPHCCLINLKGEILHTNTAWNIFCVENGGDSSTNYKGYNYLTVSCQNPNEESTTTTTTTTTTTSDPSLEDGGEYMGFLEGLRRLVAGHTLEEIQIEYPCHSDKEKRFFIATGYNVFMNNDRYVLISHELVCKKKIKKGERERNNTTESPSSPCSTNNRPDSTNEETEEDKGTVRKHDELENEGEEDEESARNKKRKT